MNPAQRAAESLERVAAAHASLLADLRHPLDPALPSGLEGWSIGHVLSHLARNADSVVRRLEASARGEHVEQYLGGAQARAAEIEQGASRSFEVLLADVATTAAALEEVAAALPEPAWSFETTALSGVRQDAATVLERRIREVVLHHTDLGIGFGPERWPRDLVAELVSETLPTLALRADEVTLAGWLTGRGKPPALAPWI